MTVFVAEYLGVRTDSLEPITPIDTDKDHPLKRIQCPFHGGACIKVSKKSDRKPPVCSVYQFPAKTPDKRNFYITCEHRLISTASHELNSYRQEKLLEVSRTLFDSGCSLDDIAYRREQTFDTGASKSRADFVLAVNNRQMKTYGPCRMIVEVQGSGETSNTATQTRHIQDWANSPTPTNAFLAKPYPKVAPIPVNAWRRQQQQLLAKAKLAVESGYGFALVLGGYFFDYLIGSVIPALPSTNIGRQGEWNVCFVPYREVDANDSSVKLEISPEEVIYTSFDLFLDALRDNEAQPNPEAFDGEYKTLNGEPVILE